MFGDFTWYFYERRSQLTFKQLLLWWLVLLLNLPGYILYDAQKMQRKPSQIIGMHLTSITHTHENLPWKPSAGKENNRERKSEGKTAVLPLLNPGFAFNKHKNLSQALHLCCNWVFSYVNGEMNSSHLVLLCNCKLLPSLHIQQSI